MEGDTKKSRGMDVMSGKNLMGVIGIFCCALTTGCRHSTILSEKVDFIIEIEGKNIPDLSKCEMLLWDRAIRKGALEPYQKDIKGPIYIDELTLQSGWGYDVLRGVLKDFFGGRAGMVTYQIDDWKSEIKSLGLDKSTPETYVKVASNAIARVNNWDSRITWRSISGFDEYYKSKNEPYSKEEEQFIISSCITSCAKNYAFAELPTIRVEPEYVYKIRFCQIYHSLFYSLCACITEATMTFYGYDNTKFAKIKHTFPPANDMSRARQELVSYLYSVLNTYKFNKTVIEGHLEYISEKEEWSIVVEEILSY